MTVIRHQRPQDSKYRTNKRAVELRPPHRFPVPGLKISQLGGLTPRNPRNNPIPDLASVWQLRITDIVHHVVRHLILHRQLAIQLIQIPHGLTSGMQLVSSIRNQYSHPVERNRFRRDSRNTQRNGVFGVSMVFLGRWKFFSGTPGYSSDLDGHF